MIEQSFFNHLAFCVCGDLCLYNGGAYAVDMNGRTVMVRAEEDNSNVQLVAEPLINGGVVGI
jgi:hypothetical protein